MSGREALLLARLLTDLADAIWRTYHVDIGLVLDEEQRPPPDQVLECDDVGDDDLPF
jgi:hypothetical protein